MESVDEGTSDNLPQERAGKVREKWRSQERGAVAELRPEEFALHSGRIGGATKLAEMGAPPWVIQREGR